VLGEIGRVTLALPGTAPADLGARIGSYLDDADAELVREAVQALGRLDAHDALPTLVGMLDDDRATVREATLWALRAMTGLRLGADTARWHAWLDEETAWWDGEAAALLSALRTRDDSRVRHALHELRKHRVHRDRIAPAIGALLASGSPWLRTEAARSLAELGAPAGVPFLREAAASQTDARLRASVIDALIALGARVPAAEDEGADEEPLSSADGAERFGAHLADRGPASR
jgi:HEAT repeat protein